MVDAINFHEQALRDKNSTPVLLVLDRVTGKIYQAGAEGDAAILQVMNYVWDPVGMEPAKMEQPSILLEADDLTITMGDVEKGVTNAYWRKFLYEYSGNNLIYKGLHTTFNIVDTDTNHFVIKYTYTANDLVKKQATFGAWTNRVGLGW